jgi:hypothetical protein
MNGKTRIAANAEFNGTGALHNDPTGEMTLADGAALSQVGLVNRGLLQIGDSSGVAAVDRFENLADGVWSLEIGGHALGDEFDHLIVTDGPATLDGLLEVLLIDAGDELFLPQIGDEFTILTAVGDVTGQFLNSPVSHAAGMQFHWSVLYDPHEVTLYLTDVTVPEPASATLVLLGAIACHAGRRTRGCAGRRFNLAMNAPTTNRLGQTSRSNEISLTLLNSGERSCSR